MKDDIVGRLEIEQKIQSALNALGLTFAEGFRIVRYNTAVRTACWRYNSRTGDETIELGDAIVNLPVSQVEMVLRHEFLHRSVYHGFGEQYDDPQISNIALDICINRLLFEAYPENMQDLSRSVYPEESKSTVIALADCSAGFLRLDEPLRSLWRSIWEPMENGLYPGLNPASLYFRLLELHDPVDFSINPFSDFADYKSGHSGEMPPKVARAASRIASRISRKLPRGSYGGEGIDEYSVIPHQLGLDNVELFIQRLHIKTIADRFSSKIKEPLLRHVSLQPYPMYPSRLGYIYQIFGIAETWLLYWNKDITSMGVRKAIGFYVDVSGSMAEHFPLVSAFVDTLKEYPIRMHSFDTVVKDIDVAEFSKGKITGGGGTDFDCVIRHFLKDPELSAALLFTDGMGDLSDSVGRSLQLSRKDMYVVYIIPQHSGEIKSNLKRYSRDNMIVEISDAEFTNYTIK